LVTPRRRSLIKPEDIWPPVSADDLKFCAPPPLVAPGVYRAPGQFAWFRGPKDGARWLERSQREKTDAATILNNRLFSVEGDKITVHVTGDTQWKFIFGRDPKGGGGGGGGRKAGKDGDSQTEFEIEMTQEEIDNLLFKGLELPNLIGKKSQVTELTGVRIEGLGKTGARSEWARKDTVRQFIKRVASIVAADPAQTYEIDVSSGFLLPVDKLPLSRLDQRYWQLAEVREPVSQALVYILVDRSGSVTQQMLELMYLFGFLLIRFLTRHYKHLKIVILGHTSDEPTEFPDWESLVKDRMTGGTTFSPSLKWIRRHAQEGNYLQTHNCYLAQGSDGDNYGADNQLSMREYMGMLDDGFNYIMFTELANSAMQGWSDGARLLRDQIPEKYRKSIHVGRVYDRPSVFSEFQKALAKDAARV
jgi:hypothetical protein